MSCSTLGVAVGPLPATFCHACGWPLRQPCPYGCGGWVDLTADGKPTGRCPDCNELLKSCSVSGCGRLHRFYERACFLHSDHELTSPFHDWVGEAGSSSGVRSADVSQSVQFQAVNHLIDAEGRLARDRIVGSSGSIRADAGLGPLAYQDGNLIAVQGRRLLRGAPERFGHRSNGLLTPMITQLEDYQPLPDSDQWRLCVSGNRLYIVGASNASVVNLGNGLPEGRVPGTFVAQASLGSSWCGVRKNGDQLELCIVQGDGNTRNVKIPFVADKLLKLLAFGSKGWLTTRSGDAYSFNPHGELEANELPAADMDGLHAFIALGNVYFLRRSRLGDIRLFCMDLGAEKTLPISEPEAAPAVVGGQVYLPDNNGVILNAMLSTWTLFSARRR